MCQKPAISLSAQNMRIVPLQWHFLMNCLAGALNSICLTIRQIYPRAADLLIFNTILIYKHMSQFHGDGD